MKTFEVMVNSDGSSWATVKKGKDVWDKITQTGAPIRISYPSGSYKVIRNADKLPKDFPASARA
tara:strand:+ start:27 stop:218 length:192 start_codon:yes stop_codon:yes gene_type:complete